MWISEIATTNREIPDDAYAAGRYIWRDESTSKAIDQRAAPIIGIPVAVAFQIIHLVEEWTGDSHEFVERHVLWLLVKEDRGLGQSPIDASSSRHPARHDGGETMTYLDAALPEWHWCETYGRWIDASHETAVKAVANVSTAEIRGLKLLLEARNLPSRLRGGPRFGEVGTTEMSLLEEMFEIGFVDLGTDELEQSFGLIDQSWKSDGGTQVKVGSAEEFARFDQPGFVKVAANIRATPQRGGTFVSTQTRILATDRRTRRVFGLYWLAVRPFSGYIRRAWLAAADRRVAH